MFNHSHTEGHLCCFHFLTMMNKAATNIHIQVFVNKNSYFSGINAYGRWILNRIRGISDFALFLSMPRLG